jgi:alpha-ketoglutarate-dependent taurine dioxygenase
MSLFADLKNRGFAASDPFGSFVSGLEAFNDVRKQLGTPRVFSWLKTTEDDSINLVESKQSTARKFGDIWHQDHAYEQDPPRYTILLSELIPRDGGETKFVCRRKIASKVSRKERERLKSGKFLISPPENAVTSSLERGISLNSRTSTGISSRDGHDVMELSPYHSKQDELHWLSQIYSVYDSLSETVTWQPNMLVVWDNFRVFHKAINNYGDQHRRMFRSIID